MLTVKASARTSAGRRVAFLDEDSVTLAVDAAWEWFRRDPNARMAKLVLGDEWEQSERKTIEAALAPWLGGPTGQEVKLESTLVRAWESNGGREAYGRITVGGHGRSDVVEPEPSLALDAPTVDLCKKWETEWPRLRTMGAHVPAGTWDRSAQARLGLFGVRRGSTLTFPPPVDSTRKQWAPLPRRGTIDSFTVVSKGAGPSEYHPWSEAVGDYVVAVANLEGARVAAPMVAGTVVTGVAIDAVVEPVLRRLYAEAGRWRYGIKLRQV